MALPYPPTEDHLLHHSIFQSITKDTRHSVQGLRTVLEIRRRLPISLSDFSHALKAVKYWAEMRHVYGNNFCFPAGVSLAVMMARVCQLFPVSAHPSLLVKFFFRFYTQWLAKHNNVSPVFITEILKPVDIPKIVGMWESWDPHRESSRDELLPVLNPAYPHNNTCYNVGRSGLEWFYKEISRAHLMLNAASTAPDAVNAANDGMVDWSALWTPYAIGDDYNSFLVVEVSEGGSHHHHRDENQVKTGQADGSFDAWILYLESKLKILLYSLETTCADPRIWPKRLAPIRHPTAHGCCWAIGVRSRKQHHLHSEGTAVDPSLFAAVTTAVEDFRYAVMELGSRGPFGFQRSPNMKEPVCYLIHQGDSAMPRALQPSSRQKATTPSPLSNVAPPPRAPSTSSSSSSSRESSASGIEDPLSSIAAMRKRSRSASDNSDSDSNDDSSAE